MTPKQEQERKLLFTVCKTKEDLHAWIEYFLRYNLPDCIVDEDSNSSPMDLVWEIYNQAVHVQDKDFESIMAYACRGGYKTLGSSAIELILMLHDRRDIVHGAALEEQSSDCLEYVKTAMRHPAMAPFTVQADDRTITVQYYKKGDRYLTSKEYAALPPDEQGKYEEYFNKAVIVPATLKALNGKHGALLVLDEADLLDNDKVIQEAEGIPTPTKDDRNKAPIVYWTSTRKKASGRVQKMIDTADREGLRVRHWNLIDITKACPPSKHSPGESEGGPYKRLPVYVDDNNLRHLSKEKYEELNEGEQGKYREYQMFVGCETCKLAPTCKSKLATHQKGTSPRLLDHSFVEKKVTKGNVEFIKSQFLCRKPLATGSIYSRFSRDKHCLTAAQIWERLEQVKHPNPEALTKADLVKYLKAHPMAEFYGGMDFGYTHQFVATVGCKVGLDWYILDTLAVTELETNECVEVTRKAFEHYQATWFPDPENPQLIKTFMKAGFRCVDFSKHKGSVLAGIDAVRAKLTPGTEAEPQMYFLKGDLAMEGEDGLLEAFEKWAWKLSATGEPTEIPQELYKDQNDSIRYFIYNITPVRGRSRGGGRPTKEQVAARPKTVEEQFWDGLRRPGELLYGQEENARATLESPDNAPRQRRKSWF